MKPAEKRRLRLQEHRENINAAIKAAEHAENWAALHGLATTHFATILLALRQEWRDATFLLEAHGGSPEL